MPPAIQILLIAVASTAAIIDLRETRVPNWLALAAALLGLAANLLTHALPGLLLALAGAGLALLVYVPLYLLRAMGAGDVKLMAALGAIAGPGHWVRLFLCTALVGVLLAAVLSMRRGRAQDLLVGLGAILSSLARGRAPHQDHPHLEVRNPHALRLPHALSIGVGTVAYLICYWTGLLS